MIWDLISDHCSAQLCFKVKVYPDPVPLTTNTNGLRTGKMSVMEENSWTGNTDIKNIVINIQCDRVVR